MLTLIKGKLEQLVILITDKADFKQGKLSGIRETLDDDKAVNFSRGHKNL